MFHQRKYGSTIAQDSVPHYKTLGKCKRSPRCANTSYLAGWLKLKSVKGWQGCARGRQRASVRVLHCEKAGPHMLALKMDVGTMSL